jgi:hypothetical protein
LPAFCFGFLYLKAVKICLEAHSHINFAKQNRVKSSSRQPSATKIQSHLLTRKQVLRTCHLAQIKKSKQIAWILVRVQHSPKAKQDLACKASIKAWIPPRKSKKPKLNFGSI